MFSSNCDRLFSLKKLFSNFSHVSSQINTNEWSKQINMDEL